MVQVKKAEIHNEKLLEQMAALQQHCRAYSLQVRELQGQNLAAIQHRQHLASALQDLRCRQQVCFISPVPT